MTNKTPTKRPIRMVDLSPLNRLTLKRNMLLQKQLNVQLQIMTEEYRMTKKDLEKNCNDLGGFLMYLQHTAPGLNVYGQPDTRAMNAKNIINNRATNNPNEKEKKKSEVLLEKLQATKSKSASSEKRERIASEGTDKEGDTSAKPPRNEFFNRRIVLDAKRRSFLQQSMGKDSNKQGVGPGSRDDARPLSGTISHAGFLSNRDTPGEASSKRRPQTSSPTLQRPRTARYGSDAYSEQDEYARKEILSKFDFIFDPENVKPQGRIRKHGLEATPIALPKEGWSTGDDATSVDPSKMSSQPTSSYILNRRVAWSAPPKRREAPPQDQNSTNVPSQPSNRQSMSVTPRSGMSRYKNRCKSAAPIPNTDPVGEAAGTNRNSPPESQQIAAARQNHPGRPKTAPPVYQLMQRNVSAPRQQVAGILAEIQSRRAATRAMLLKSKQLKKMVKSLAPQDANDDELSD